MYYTYIHRKSDNGSIFYVGKGKRSRVTSLSGRNKHWRNTVKTHGFYHEFVVKDVDEELAFLVEEECISKLKEIGFKLCNYSTGGEGASGVVHTEETKRKYRDAKLGKKQSPEHAAKSASAKVGKKQPQSAVDYVIGLKKKKVINSIGEVFSSASDAARLMSERLGSNCSQGNISMVCRGERNEAYGFKWSYNINKIPKTTNRSLVCSNGKVFGSVVEASRWVESFRGKSSPTNITNAIRTKGTAYGLKWSYEIK